MKKSYKKYRRIKKKKSIFYNRFFWLLILAVIVIIGLFYLLFLSPVFQIKSVKIQGQFNFVKADDIKTFIEVSISRNIFLVRRASLKNLALKEFFPVQDLKIRKKLPASLIVEVFERVPVANFYQGEDCYFVGEQGIIFEKSDSEMLVLETERNETSLGQKVVEKELLSKALYLVRRLGETLSINIPKCFVSASKIETRTKKGWLLIFDPQKDLDEQIEDLKLILVKQISEEDIDNIDYVDLRFGYIFYKLK